MYIYIYIYIYIYLYTNDRTSKIRVKENLDRYAYMPSKAGLVSGP